MPEFKPKETTKSYLPKPIKTDELSIECVTWNLNSETPSGQQFVHLILDEVIIPHMKANSTMSSDLLPNFEPPQKNSIKNPRSLSSLSPSISHRRASRQYLQGSLKGIGKSDVFAEKELMRDLALERKIARSISATRGRVKSRSTSGSSLSQPLHSHKSSILRVDVPGSVSIRDSKDDVSSIAAGLASQDLDSESEHGHSSSSSAIAGSHQAARSSSDYLRIPGVESALGGSDSSSFDPTHVPQHRRPTVPTTIPSAKHSQRALLPLLLASSALPTMLCICTQETPLKGKRKIDGKKQSSKANSKKKDKKKKDRGFIDDLQHGISLVNKIMKKNCSLRSQKQKMELQEMKKSRQEERQKKQRAKEKEIGHVLSQRFHDRMLDLETESSSPATPLSISEEGSKGQLLSSVQAIDGSGDVISISLQDMDKQDSDPSSSSSSSSSSASSSDVLSSPIESTGSGEKGIKGDGESDVSSGSSASTLPARSKMAFLDVIAEEDEDVSSVSKDDASYQETSEPATLSSDGTMSTGADMTSSKNSLSPFDMGSDKELASSSSAAAAIGARPLSPLSLSSYTMTTEGTEGKEKQKQLELAARSRGHMLHSISQNSASSSSISSGISSLSTSASSSSSSLEHDSQTHGSCLSTGSFRRNRVPSISQCSTGESTSTILDLIPPRYVLLRSHTLQALSLSIFVLSSALQHFSSFSSTHLPCGGSGLTTNKGAVYIQCVFKKERRLCFCGVHLPAHKQHYERRNVVLEKILGRGLENSMAEWKRKEEIERANMMKLLASSPSVSSSKVSISSSSKDRSSDSKIKGETSSSKKKRGVSSSLQCNQLFSVQDMYDSRRCIRVVGSVGLERGAAVKYVKEKEKEEEREKRKAEKEEKVWINTMKRQKKMQDKEDARVAKESARKNANNNSKSTSGGLKADGSTVRISDSDALISITSKDGSKPFVEEIDGASDVSKTKQPLLGDTEEDDEATDR
ncbi:hypothetical protein ADUPG1_006848, partial [Aduncisulcus paluster]